LKRFRIKTQLIYKDGKVLYILKTYHAEIPSNIDSIKKTVPEIISSIQNVYGELDDDIIFDVKVILNELLVNAIKHGNSCCPDYFVKITAGVLEDDSAFFIIEDQGQGYNYEFIRRENLNHVDSLHEFRETGRGILIVENLCNRIYHNKKGNKVIAVKKLSKD